MEDYVIHIDIEKKIHTAEGLLNLSVNTGIRAGEFVSLFGASGAGKTTLLRLISGLISPDKGSIRFGNTVWFDSTKKINLPPQRRDLSFMFQDYALFPSMNVEENILYAQKKKDSRAADELIELFGLTEFKKKRPSGLSGGQKQRVALARALARRPRLLLLDEPLSSVGMEMRLALQKEILRAHELCGATTLMVSHELSEVFRLSDKVLLIQNGRVYRSGLPEEVFSDSTISGKVQITGQIVKIEPQDTFTIITIVSGYNQVLRITAFENDMENINLGDHVLVYTKAFNPVISKLNV